MGLVSPTNNDYLKDFLPGGGAVDDMSLLLGLHPRYSEIYQNTHTNLLQGDGALPATYRHYIAIMACSRYGCDHLVSREKMEFLAVDGDPAWLEGLHRVPYKLRRLGEMNKILAHRPWLLNQTHIKSLTTGDESWSLSEIVHAIVILVHFHAASSFVFGCGLGNTPVAQSSRRTGSLPRGNHDKENNKTEMSGALSSKNANTGPTSKTNGLSSKEGSPLRSLPGSPSGGDRRVCVDTLMKRMRTLTDRVEEFNQDEMSARFQRVETQAASISPSKDKGTHPIAPHLMRFAEDVEYQYEDFSRRREVGIQKLSIQDYSWDIHGISVLSRFYTDISLLLDDKFRMAANLTYNTMGNKANVDTSTFRRAIWNYIQCIYGIRHDDYDYEEINQLLERSLKAFIKTSVSHPARLSEKDINSVMTEFDFTEKVHVNIMVMDAKMEASLLYGLRAVMKHMT